MQHPAVVGDVVYVRPRGYKIADGAVTTEAVPDGGCGTISACANSMMFRAGNIRMWDPQSGKSSDWARLCPLELPVGKGYFPPHGKKSRWREDFVTTV